MFHKSLCNIIAHIAVKILLEADFFRHQKRSIIHTTGLILIQYSYFK